MGDLVMVLQCSTTKVYFFVKCHFKNIKDLHHVIKFDYCLILGAFSRQLPQQEHVTEVPCRKGARINLDVVDTSLMLVPDFRLWMNFMK